MRRPGPLLLLGVLACVALLAWSVRELNNVRITSLPGTSAEAGWFCQDPDSLYHMRRLERALEEGSAVAARDPFLNTPHGARIPWPPYYTLAAATLLGPFAPGAGAQDSTRREFIEHGIATLPVLFGVLAALACTLAAWRLGGMRAAWIAGASFALMRASIDYSAPGNGDHHAWSTFLMAAMFAVCAAGLESSRTATRARGVLTGLIAGALAGLLLGSWVGGLVHVMIVQLALGLALWMHTRETRPALPTLGLAFHLALVATLAPAVLSSPWTEDLPWMVVNLSWFHLALPLIGAAIFLVPVLRTRLPRAYPWWVAGGIALLGLLTVATDLPFARGVREGFAWAGRSNLFMAYITESQPLLWGQIGSPTVVSNLLGFGAWLVLPLGAWACWRALRAGRLGYLLWAIALPVMLTQALAQRRFAEACGVPLAVLLGLGFAALLAEGGPRWPRWLERLRTLPALALALTVLAPIALQWPTVQGTAQRVSRGETNPGGPVVADLRSTRQMLEWLREHTPEAGERGVLAAWDQGHAIEWVAGLPTVATNFGSYVGADSYLDPMRFFLSEDPAEGEALLREREARFVFLPGSYSKDLEVMLRLVRPNERNSFVTQTPGEGPRMAPRWYRTLAARLMLTGKIGDPVRAVLGGDSLDFVRLVHVSPAPLNAPLAIPHTNGQVSAGWIWERVEGARVTARGQPGEQLEVQFDVEYAQAGRRLHWSHTALIGADGTAAVRVPYASDATNGDGQVIGPVQWSLADRAGTVIVTERAVLSGAEVPLL